LRPAGRSRIFNEGHGGAAAQLAYTLASGPRIGVVGTLGGRPVGKPKKKATETNTRLTLQSVVAFP
jgi:hypothetical protein